MWAAAERLPAMVRLLVDHGADVNAHDRTSTCGIGTSPPSHGASNMPLGGWTPLLFSARQGCLECAKILVEAGADLNFQDPDLVPPVVTAIVSGHYDVAAYLIEKGADVNLADRWGRAALWAAVDMHTTPHSGRPTSSNPRLSAARNFSSSCSHMAPMCRHSWCCSHPIVPWRIAAATGVLTIGATPLVRAAKAARHRGDPHVARKACRSERGSS